MRVDLTQTFDLKKLVGTSEEELITVRSDKYALKVYGLVINEQSGSANKLTINRYQSDGSTLIESISFSIGANDTLDISRNPESPILTFYSGEVIKVVASADSIQLIMNVYYLPQD